MNVLISGNLSSLASTFVSAFLKEKFKVVLVSSHADTLNIHLPNVRVHSVSPATDHFNDIVSAHSFDVVILLLPARNSCWKAVAKIPVKS